jgi:hypothetical protein
MHFIKSNKDVIPTFIFESKAVMSDSYVTLNFFIAGKRKGTLGDLTIISF